MDPTMKFADHHPGQVIEAGPVSVTEDEIIRFAGAWDPQVMHTDPAGAARGRFGGLIASGWHTCAIAMRLAVENVLDGSEVIASPGVERLRWPHPVRPGDRLTLRITVLDARRSRSQPNLGVIRWRWQVLNQHHAEVLELEATNLYDLG
jgi:acyl dehydratase